MAVETPDPNEVSATAGSENFLNLWKDVIPAIKKKMGYDGEKFDVPELDAIFNAGLTRIFAATCYSQKKITNGSIPGDIGNELVWKQFVSLSKKVEACVAKIEFGEAYNTLSDLDRIEMSVRMSEALRTAVPFFMNTVIPRQFKIFLQVEPTVGDERMSQPIAAFEEWFKDGFWDYLSLQRGELAVLQKRQQGSPGVVMA